jgi:poly [ADP-ribose] polymerase
MTAMSCVIEPAKTGRAACRGCRKKIAAGELRMGEGAPSSFGDRETQLWFHLSCAAYKRPEPLLGVLDSAPLPAEEQARLRAIAEFGAAHRRVPRIDGVERSPSARARCRACRQPIDKGLLRIRLVYYEEGVFSPSGNVHASCARDYFETDPAGLVERIAHFSESLSGDDRRELEEALRGEAALD